MTRMNAVRLTLAMLAAMVVMVGCQAGETAKSSTAPAATPSAAKTAQQVPATPTTMEKVRVGQVFSSGAMGPFWVTKDEGIFRKYGLDVETVNINGLPAAVAALNSAQADAFLTSPGVTTLRAAAKDMDLVLVHTFSNSLAYKLIARPEIKTVQDLKGKKLAGAKVGDAEYYLTRNALAKLGVNPDDLEFRTVGLQPERLPALVQGMVDVSMFTPPTDLIAKKQGMIQLADMGDLGIPYVGNSVYVRKSLAKEKPQVVENMVKALTEGMYVFRTNKEVATRAIKAYMKIDDQEVLEYTWNAVVSRLETTPLPSAQGLREVIAISSFEDPTLKDLPVEKVADTSFVKKIEASGFIDDLYKGRK